MKVNGAYLRSKEASNMFCGETTVVSSLTFDLQHLILYSQYIGILPEQLQHFFSVCCVGFCFLPFIIVPLPRCFSVPTSLSFPFSLSFFPPVMSVPCVASEKKKKKRFDIIIWLLIPRVVWHGEGSEEGRGTLYMHKSTQEQCNLILNYITSPG